MELAASLIPTLSSPICAFVDIEEFMRESDSSEVLHLPFPDYLERIRKTVKETRHPRWRIDGCGNGGSQFFAIPLFMHPEITPLRIDVYIPDQRLHPPELRNMLQSSALCQATTVDINEIGIVQYILIALENWSNKQDALKERFVSLPFGSRIVLPTLVPDPTDVEIYISPGHHIERKLLSLDSLKSMLDLPASIWPVVIDIERLHLHKQIKDSISLVSLKDEPSLEFMVFKSCIHGIDYLYHELKQLLSLPPHPNILRSPTHLVSKKCKFGGKTGICGFLLPFYRSGALSDVLSRLAATDTVRLGDQFRWALQISSALEHIHYKGKTYYSDLRPDNILLSNLPVAVDGVASDKDKEQHAVLIDFEQRGNCFSWLPPEIVYLQYLHTLSSSNCSNTSSTPSPVPNSAKTHFAALLQRTGYSLAPLSRAGFPSLVDHSNAWRALGPAQQESAMVFTLGKLLWCIFECVGSIANDPWRATLSGSDIQFPEFRQTPRSLRALVVECTAGASEHRGRFPRLVRNGEMVFPVQGGVGTGEKAVLEIAKAWWKEEIEDMEMFFGGGGVGTMETSSLVSNGEPLFLRPSLKEVRSRLEGI